jgi:hypothetical protein
MCALSCGAWAACVAPAHTLAPKRLVASRLNCRPASSQRVQDRGGGGVGDVRRRVDDGARLFNIF